MWTILRFLSLNSSICVGYWDKRGREPRWSNSNCIGAPNVQWCTGTSKSSLADRDLVPDTEGSSNIVRKSSSILSSMHSAF